MSAEEADQTGTLAMGALAGVRVLDLTRHLAGPYATTILGDLGADVTKVESTPKGDPTRALHGATEDRSADSQAFVVYNHGKRSIAIDLRSDDGRELVREIARQSDVLIENYRPGVMARMGLAYEDLKGENERLIYCSVSAFGREGPWSDQPATDPVVQAMSGLIRVTGWPDAPVRVGVPIGDVVGAFSAVIGILAALQSRHHTGQGQHVDVSLMHALLFTQTTRLAELFAGGGEPVGHGTAHNLVAPYELFDTADGQVIAGSWSEDTWPRFCEAIGLPDLAHDPRFVDNPSRVAHRAELRDLISAELIREPTAFWEERFHRARALFGPMLSVSEALAHPQMQHRPPLTTYGHPTLGEVSVPNTASAIRLGSAPSTAILRPPIYGEHTEEVLHELGLEPERIEDLIRAGVVHAPQRTTA